MIKKFIKHTGIVVPLDIPNIDTDAIIPKQFLQKLTRIGFGDHLFHNWRFNDEEGKIPNTNFVLNKPNYKNASILLTRENFGCGSSREHAPWALIDFGLQVIIAPSFADIFYSNSFNNQLLLITLSEEEVKELFLLVNSCPGINFTINLESQTVAVTNKIYKFNINKFHRYCIMHGIDAISLTLRYEMEIMHYENNQPVFLY